jgi:hypothetical protein
MQANIANSGDINATQVTLSAGQAKDTLNRVVNNSGLIKATGFSSLNGEIVLQGGTTLNSGTLDATSATGNGGTVHMLGQHVGVVDSGSIDVSGATGGGTILVGGDYQGKNASIENAEVTYVGAQTTLKADATQNGNGGKVIVWADDTTRAYGSISAQGGALGGNGGFVETSGHNWLDMQGVRVNAGANIGYAGAWLLDPNYDITISHSSGPGTPIIAGTFDTATLGLSSSIGDYDINLALGSTNVSLLASKDIVFNGSGVAINSGVARNLTLTAGGQVLTNSGADLTLGGPLTVVVATQNRWDNNGIVTLSGNSSIRLYDGTSASEFRNVGTLNVNTGHGWAFNSPSDIGVISNHGTINVNSATAFEAIYNQNSSSVLNVYASNLDLQNAHSVEGNINLSSVSELNINEYHGTTASLSNLTIAGGTVNVFEGAARIIPKVSFFGVTARNTTLNVGFDDSPNDDFFAGEAIIAGNTIFNNVNFIKNNGFGTDGRFEIINAKLGIASSNSFTVPAEVIHTGNVGYYVAGDLTVDSFSGVVTNATNGITTNGSLSLMAGWDGTSLSSPVVSNSVTGNLLFDRLNTFSAPIVTAGGDINLDASGIIDTSSFSTQIISLSPSGRLTANVHNLSNMAGAIFLDSDNHVAKFSAHNYGSTGYIDFSNQGYSTPGDVVVDSVINDASGESIDIYSDGSITLGLLDAGAGTGDVYVAADKNITKLSGSTNNILASYAELIAGNSGVSTGSINLDTQVQTLEVYNQDGVGSAQTISIHNTGSPLLVNAYSSDYTNTLEITNNNSIHIGHIGGAVDTTITATGTTSDIQLGSIGCSCSTILSEGNVTLTAGHDVLIYDDHVSAGTGMDVTAGRDIIVTANANNASLYTASGNQNITAGRNITLTGGSSSIGAYAEIKHAGSGNQIIDFINGGTLTLTGGTGISGNRARIENASLAGNNSIQKIWRSTSGLAPAIVMNGGASGGLDSTTSNDLSNSAEIGSEFGQQIIYASTIAMAGMGGATGYAGAIISAPNQQITTTGSVTLTGGSSTSLTAGIGDQFTYNSVTYNLASPAAIGDKNTLIQMLDIGGTLTLNAGSSTSGIAMVGSLHGVATGSIKANAVALNSSGSLAFLGGVEDIIVTNTFANVGGAITDNSSGSHPWSIWALNPTKLKELLLEQ